MTDDTDFSAVRDAAFAKSMRAQPRDADHDAKIERQRQEQKAKGQVINLNRPKLQPIQKWDTFNDALPHHGSIIKGLVQEGSIYALTGFTGHAKTTMALYMAMHISEGGPFFGSTEHEVKQSGTVVFISGENPANVRDQWLACCLDNQIHPRDTKVVFIPDRFDHESEMEELLIMLGAIDDLRMIIVDTLQSFFLGEDDNSNAAMGNFARSWRPVANLDSKPTVLINCHPAGKDAKDAKDNLVPRGGGAFINEIDANLSVYRNGSEVTLHWAGKYRGKYPEPIKFELVDKDFDEIKDTDGDDMPMAVLQITTQATRESQYRAETQRMEDVLNRLDSGQPCTQTALAEYWGTNIRQVRNVIDQMIGKKLIIRAEIGGKIRATPKGIKEQKRIKAEAEAYQESIVSPN